MKQTIIHTSYGDMNWRKVKRLMKKTAWACRYHPTVLKGRTARQYWREQYADIDRRVKNWL